MSKKLSDYIHLYIGCEVIGTYNDGSGSKGFLTGVTNGATECEIQFLEEDGVNVSESPEWNDVKDVKPILRPLSDMTKEEWEHAVKNIFEFGATEHHKQNDALWSRKQYTDERLRLSLDLDDYNSPHYWTGFTDESKKTFPPLKKIIAFINYCRSIGIDMDGLVAEGVAIDKTKQEQSV